MRFLLIFCIALLSGCVATAPRGNVQDEVIQKQFLKPTQQDEVILYIYRDQDDSFTRDVMTKQKIWVNSIELGGLIADSYFYIKVPQGITSIETESEFEKNELTFDAIGGRIYFVKQYLKGGFWRKGAEVAFDHDMKGKQTVLRSRLLKPL